MTRLALLLMMIFFAAGVSAQHAPPLKKENFEVIWYWPFIDENCPADMEDVRRVWKSELLRARLKNDLSVQGKEGFFHFSVRCMEQPESRHIFVIETSWMWTDGDFLPSVQLSKHFGIGRSDTLVEYMKKNVEEAITKYLEANLD